MAPNLEPPPEHFPDRNADKLILQRGHEPTKEPSHSIASPPLRTLNQPQTYTWFLLVIVIGPTSNLRNIHQPPHPTPIEIESPGTLRENGGPNISGQLDNKPTTHTNGRRSNRQSKP